MDITVTRDVIAALTDEARRAGAKECCGLLLGARDEPASIIRAVPAANVHPEPARFFEIDPIALIAAYRAERGGGPALLGFYHSHPTGHPRPSATDCEHAGGDDRVWAIIAGEQVRFWRDTSHGFVAVAIRIVTG